MHEKYYKSCKHILNDNVLLTYMALLLYLIVDFTARPSKNRKRQEGNDYKCNNNSHDFCILKAALDDICRQILYEG